MIISVHSIGMTVKHPYQVILNKHVYNNYINNVTFIHILFRMSLSKMRSVCNFNPIRLLIFIFSSYFVYIGHVHVYNYCIPDLYMYTSAYKKKTLVSVELLVA